MFHRKIEKVSCRFSLKPQSIETMVSNQFHEVGQMSKWWRSEHQTQALPLARVVTGAAAPLGRGGEGLEMGKQWWKTMVFFYNQESWEWKGFTGIWRFLKMVDPPKSHWFTKMV